MGKVARVTKVTNIEALLIENAELSSTANKNRQLGGVKQSGCNEGVYISQGILARKGPQIQTHVSYGTWLFHKRDRGASLELGGEELEN